MHEDTRALIRALTPFFKRNLANDSHYERLLNVYRLMFESMHQMVDERSRAMYLQTSDTMETIPYFKVDISKALYPRDRARSLLLQEFEDVIDLLDKEGLYVSFLLDSVGKRQRRVADALVKTSFAGTEELKLYKDYFIRENRLYLLPAFVERYTSDAKRLHLFDIKVQNEWLEHTYGHIFQLETGPYLPREEYRSVLEGFDEALAGNHTIGEIKTAIRKVTNWDSFTMYDIKSRDLPPVKKRLYDDWFLSPATFIVSVPEEIIFDKIRVNILHYLLWEVKESQTNYYLFYEVLRKEILPTIDTVHTKALVMKQEVASFGDSAIVRPFFREYPLDWFLAPEQYTDYDDENMLADVANRYDYDEVVSFDFDSTMDNSHFDSLDVVRFEKAEVRHVTFPEIPRSLTIKKTGQSVEISCRSNVDGTTHFEVWASTEKYGTYTKIASFANNLIAETSSGSIGVPAGYKYLQVRAVAGEHQSLPTIALDMTTL